MIKVIYIQYLRKKHDIIDSIYRYRRVSFLRKHI